MKVLHVLSSNIFSGAENVVCQIIAMFKSVEGVNMAYASPSGTNISALQERDINYLPLHDISVGEVKRVIEEYNPDIAHAHDMRASFISARACKSLPLISHIHNNAFNSRGISPKSIAYLYAGLRARNIIWVSDSAFNGYAFHNVFKKKSTILYNVIDEDDLKRRLSEDTNVYDFDIIFIGRMEYPKNVGRLLTILKIACDKKPDIKIGIVGNGEEEEDMHSLCTSLNLDANVTFLGFRANPLKMLNDSKIMMMTSRWEGLPMVALEAIALHVPIVSTPTDGLKFLVQNGRNGFLSDDNEEFADILVKVLTDDGLRQDLVEGQKSRSLEVNNIENYRDTLMELYKINE